MNLIYTSLRGVKRPLCESLSPLSIWEYLDGAHVLRTAVQICAFLLIKQLSLVPTATHKMHWSMQLMQSCFVFVGHTFVESNYILNPNGKRLAWGLNMLHWLNLPLSLQIWSPTFQALRLRITVHSFRPAAIRAYSRSEDRSGLPSLCLCLGNHCHLIQQHHQQGGYQTVFWHRRGSLNMGRQRWEGVKQWLTPGVC